MFLLKPIVVHVLTYIGLGTGPPEWVVAPKKKWWIKTDYGRNKVQYKEVEHWKTPMKRHFQLKWEITEL